MVSLWQIMSTFMKVGGFTLGGGYAMLPMIEREVIDRRGWVERQEVLDIYAMAQSMPGAIGINSAMFIGYRLRGIPGAVAAAIGMITPSFLVILLIAQGFSRVQDNPIVVKLMRGAGAGVVALIFYAAWSVARRSVKKRLDLAIGLLAFVAVAFNLLSAIMVIILAALYGVASWWYAHRLHRDAGSKELGREAKKADD